jgi:hypothetical protein
MEKLMREKKKEKKRRRTENKIEITILEIQKQSLPQMIMKIT